MPSIRCIGSIDAARAGMTPEKYKQHRQHSRELDRINNKDFKADNSDRMELLVLGTPDGGKSTLVKQMLNVYQSHYSNDASRREQVPVLRTSVVHTVFGALAFHAECADAVRAARAGASSPRQPPQPHTPRSSSGTRIDASTAQCVTASFEQLRYAGDPSAGGVGADAAFVLDTLRQLAKGESPDTISIGDVMGNKDLCDAIVRLCSLHGGAAGPRRDAGLLLAIDRCKTFGSSRMTSVDSAEYMVANAARIMRDGYDPTAEDIVRVRVRTHGATKTDLAIYDGTLRVRMIDVGGQRMERMKWAQFFDDVDVIVFVASIAEFDRVLVEDTSVNRMVESVRLFASLLGREHTQFQSTPFVLFLNKNDLLGPKLRKMRAEGVDVVEHLARLATQCGNTGLRPRSDAEADVRRFICDLYVKQNRTSDGDESGRMVYAHDDVVAIDPDNILKVFDACRDVLGIDAIGDAGVG